MTLYAGIDGGQSSTTAVVGDATRELGRGSGPPADLVGLARDAARQAQALDAALAAALAAAGLPADAPLTAVVAGLSGFEPGSALPALRAHAGRTRVAHDAEVAHAGAFAGGEGTLILAGTGSVALARRADGECVRTGGWGAAFGDEGSAFWLGRAAVAAAMRAEDRDETEPLGTRALAFFGVPSLRALQLGFAHGDIGRPAVAAFAREVLALAAEPSGESARALTGRAQGELASLAAVAFRRLPGLRPLFSFAGGLFRDAAFADGVASRIEALVPGAEVRPPAGDPAAGALRLARTA